MRIVGVELGIGVIGFVGVDVDDRAGLSDDALGKVGGGVVDEHGLGVDALGGQLVALGW